MNYLHFQMLNGTTIVTINSNEPAANYYALAHLERVGSNKRASKQRFIYSDRGDRSRFRAFEKAVEEGTEKGVSNG